MITPAISLGQLLDAPGGRPVAARYLGIDIGDAVQPELLELNLDAFFRVTPGLRDDPAHRDRFWSDLDAVMGPILLHDHAGEAGPPLRSAVDEWAEHA